MRINNTMSIHIIKCLIALKDFRNKSFKVFYILILTSPILLSIGFTQVYQNSFDKGFKIGFKEGACYNKSSLCLAPLTPLTPLLRINENTNSYTDGYNRGFQVGLDLSRINISNELGYLPNSFIYPKQETFKSSQYILPIDLSLLANVLARKQAIYNSRDEWIQNSFNRISDLSYSVLKEKNETYYKAMMTAVDAYADILNNNNYDITNDNIFVQIQDAFKFYEKRVYDFLQLTQKNQKLK